MEENRKWNEEALPEESVPAEAGAEQGREAEHVWDALAQLTDKVEKLCRDQEEARKVSAMEPEQRAAYEAQSRERALEEREKAILRREARADVLEQLAAKGLPAALADAVRCDSPEEAKRSVAALETAFREAVQTAVEARLKGVSPIAGASAQDEGELDDESYYRLRMGGQSR